MARKKMGKEEIMDVLRAEGLTGTKASYTEELLKACEELDRDSVQDMHKAVGSPFFAAIPLPPSAPQPRGLAQREAVDALFTASGEELGRVASGADGFEL